MNSIHFSDSKRSYTVGKILCLGRNYAAHAKEMKAEVPDLPVVFMKPSTALVRTGGKIAHPPFSNELQFEAEMVVAIGKRGRNIPQSEAHEYVAGYGVGIDMTLRDIQAEAKKRGLPWTVAKGFDTSAPVSDFVHREVVHDPHNLEITLQVNGELRQHSNTNQMIFRVDFIVSHLSSIFTLEQGDIIFTGTPEGVGTVVSGDLLCARLESVGSVEVRVS